MARRVTRREFIAASAGAAALTSGRRTPAQQPSSFPPNLLFILADDLGYGDLSCYGRPDYRTPVLDGLAKEGIRFLSAYAAAPVCTPTRCAFVTGRYPQRLDVGLYEPLRNGIDQDKGLPPEHPTIASLLKNNGYETALIGKWHLGWKPEFGPNRHGFDEFFGILSGAGDYFTHQASNKEKDLWENLKPIERVGYLTDLLSDRAVEFIRRRRQKPFYLSLHYTAPHSPWEGPEDEAIGHTTHGPGPMLAGGSMKIYASMMRSMDAGIGRVLATLRAANLDRRTLVIFTSDNGGERYSMNWPFSFQKFDLWEGGIRVPAIVRWTGIVSPGRTTEQAAVTMDWTATMLAAARARADAAYPLDGEDLLAVCKGTRPVFDRTLYWRTRAHQAVRIGQWKYLREAGNEHLFDLSVDLGEKVDEKANKPDIFSRLKGRFADWNRQMLPLT